MTEYEGLNDNQGGACVVSGAAERVLNTKLSPGGHDQQPALNEDLLKHALTPENLQRAWKRVKGNRGGPGVDDIRIEDYPQWAHQHWEATRRALLGGYYIPKPVKRVEIPKPNGGVRLLGIPTVNDRVIQQAIAQVLTPLIDPSFSASSFGFRPRRNAHGAVRQLQRYMDEGFNVAVDIDLSKFFDRVDHDRLMDRVKRHVGDKGLLKLMGRYLRAGVKWEGDIQPTRKGVPQGGPLSPLLANLMLDDLDNYLESRQLKFARYADDFTICVKSTSAGYRVLHSVSRFLREELKLVVNEAKSQVVSRAKLRFLGFCFRGSRIGWSRDTLIAVKWQIRRLTKRSWGISMERRYRELCGYLRGWISYFGLTDCRKPIVALDQWVRRRIRMCYLKQWRKPKTRIRELIRLGVSKRMAIRIGLSSKGVWRLSRTKALHWAMSKERLARQGLCSIQDEWVKFHYPRMG